MQLQTSTAKDVYIIEYNCTNISYYTKVYDTLIKYMYYIIVVAYIYIVHMYINMQILQT